LITGARVRKLDLSAGRYQSRVLGFQDRYRALPGDYAAADTNINCDGSAWPKGNGNGSIESASTPINDSVTHEGTLV